MRPSLAFTELIALICVRAMAVVQRFAAPAARVTRVILGKRVFGRKFQSARPRRLGTLPRANVYPAAVYRMSAGSPARIVRSELCCRFGTLPASAAARMAAMLAAQSALL